MAVNPALALGRPLVFFGPIFAIARAIPPLGSCFGAVNSISARRGARAFPARLRGFGALPFRGGRDLGLLIRPWLWAARCFFWPGFCYCARYSPAGFVFCGS